MAAAAATGLALFTYNPSKIRSVHCDSPETPENPARLDGQAQLTAALNHPGIFLAGSNEYGVVDPEAPPELVTAGTTRPLKALSGQVLRSVALGTRHAAAIDEAGNLVQWGAAVAPLPHTPMTTVRGLDLCHVTVTDDAVFATSRRGVVYRVNLSAERDSALSQIATIACPEPVKQIAAGAAHVLALTTSGKVYALASTAQGNAAGQSGSDPSKAESHTSFHPVAGLAGQTARQVACGDRHSIVLTTEGRVYSFGENLYGQLGLKTVGRASAQTAHPTEVVLALEPNAKVAAVAAGGNVTAVSVESPDTFSVLTFGCGLGGQLGTGSVAHVSPQPGVVKEISGRRAWSERAKAVKPVRISAIVLGKTHAAAVLDTGRSADQTPAAGDDVYVWGSNRHGQLLQDRAAGNAATQAVPINARAIDYAAGGSLAIAVYPGAERLSLVHPVNLRKCASEVQQRVCCGDGTTAVYVSQARPCFVPSIWRRAWPFGAPAR